MRIFYIGSSTPKSTSRHRADALVRIGHRVTRFDPFVALGGVLGGPVMERLHYRTGYRLLQPMVRAMLEARAGEVAMHDAIWIDAGELFGRRSVAFLANLAPTVLVCLDDPAGGRDGRRFDSLVEALPAYDLCVAFREPTVQDFRRLGARRTLRVWMGYDEVAHRPPSDDEREDFGVAGGVVFIGSWMPREDREAVVLGLMDRGVPMSVWGDRWSRSPHWSRIRSAWRGGALYGRDYCMRLAGADACLGLVSRGNRDEHTTRSLETPFIGGLLVGQRTGEHTGMFEDGVEALLWNDLDECAAHCLGVMADPGRGRGIRAAGMARIRRGGFGNETLTGSILSELMAS
ncbi:MAG: glycosyltransferase [Pseudomonadota bacterium]